MTDEIDIEALQAQIDLSNSVAYDLVSSWMKPTKSSSTPSALHAISRELEEYAKRPPRLGLGATVSKSSLATSREATRLKGKLIDRKRPRHEDASASGAGMVANGQSDDDEGESRSVAISAKQVRVNGVGVGYQKRGKGKGKTRFIDAKPTLSGNSVVVVEGNDNQTKGRELSPQGHTIPHAESSWSRTNPFIIPKTPPPSAFGDHSVIDLVSSSPARLAPLEDGPPPSKKRKKKRKNRGKSKRNEDDSVNPEEEEWRGFSDPPLVAMGIAMSLGEESFGQPQALGSSRSLIVSTPFFTTDLTSPAKSMPSRNQRSSPILDLHGPPKVGARAGSMEATLQKKVESPGKKKPRRRRGKGRTSHGGGGEAV